ncbi:hypothetical protein BUALT_Bualt05G0058200 [Buddleja alternifolia]|uniref:Uncharacterized protein n=1 Tax=Buddleja alternifolia TaxID=168488 RepID=A0AAV6XH11_9LAMI|nr:hypothetical protein BUALT_Bualt05G0058200 [Buddleja alternifolia]
MDDVGPSTNEDVADGVNTDVIATNYAIDASNDDDNQKMEYLVIIDYWFDQDRRLQKRVFNFIQIPPLVEVLGLKMWRCLEDWDIEDAKIKVFIEIVKQLNFTERKSIDDCQTRWNSTYEMLAIAVKLRAVFLSYHIPLGSYYPTSNLFLHEVYRVKLVLDSIKLQQGRCNYGVKVPAVLWSEVLHKSAQACCSKFVAI